MINWELFSENLKKVKYKHVVIFNFFNLMEFFDDENASTILRFILQNYFDIFVKYPFYKLSKFIPVKKYPETLTILVNFYNLIKEKTQLIIVLSKWYGAFENKDFWKKDAKSQLEFLLELKNKIQGIFDCSAGGQSFGVKSIPIIKLNMNNSKEVVFETGKERLAQIYKLMGRKFFKIAKIPILLACDFDYMTDEEKIKYIILVHSKTIAVLDQTIEIYENFIMINLKIDNLLNPFLVNIENDTFTDYDVEDIKTLL